MIKVMCRCQRGDVDSIELADGLVYYSKLCPECYDEVKFFIDFVRYACERTCISKYELLQPLVTRHVFTDEQLGVIEEALENMK